MPPGVEAKGDHEPVPAPTPPRAAGGSRPRIGIPVTYQFSVRYVLHTGLLGRLAAVAQPVVLLGWDDPELAARLEDAGAEVRALPDGPMGGRYLRHRRQVDLLHQRRLASPSSAIDWRRKDSIYPPRTRLRRRLRRSAERLPSLLPGGPERVLATEARLLEEDTGLRGVEAALPALDLDAVVSVTPYHRREELFLRAAHRAGMPMVTSIISFDNTTCRPWIGVPFTRYLVWNAHNRRELLRAYTDLDPGHITVTGAPQLDFYANPRWSWDEATWRDRLGLDPERPVVLFGGGPEVLVPNEPTFLRQLDEAITSGELPGQPTIVFRRHPMDPQDRWAPVLGRCSHVVSDEPWRVGATGAVETSSAEVGDIERLVSTLAHSAVHVSTSSTMTVDGAWFDRPQVGPAYDDGPGRPHDRQVRDLYRREHWLPIAASGGMDIVHSRDELVAAVRRGLTHPEEGAEGRRRLLAEIVTSPDGRATERVVAGIAEALGLPAPDPGPPGAPHPDDLPTGRP